MPMGLRLLTPVSVQTVCQSSRAAGVLVFHHVGQPMPDAVVGACEALGTRQARGSRAPPYYRRRSASRANRCDDVVSLGQHVVSATRRRTPPRGLPWGDGRGTGGGTGQKASRSCWAGAGELAPTPVEMSADVAIATTPFVTARWSRPPSSPC